MVWGWDSFNTWMDVWDAVSSFSWEWNWFSLTVSEGLSFWSVWAVFEAGWIGGCSWNWDVSWDNVCWPWSIKLLKSIWGWEAGFTWIDVWHAVVSFGWEWNSSDDTTCDSLSLWSVWAMLKAGWIS